MDMQDTTKDWSSLKRTSFACSTMMFSNPKWLSPFLDHFEKHPKTAVAQPHIMDLNQPNRFEYGGAAGGLLTVWAIPIAEGGYFNYIEDDHGQYDKDEKYLG